MGECDFKSTYDLYLEKTGQKEGFKGNWATQRGIDAEPEIKRLYERRTGYSIISPVLECQEFPILSASLDGWFEEEQLVVEFKYPSKEKHQLALSGRVPKTYQLQLQAQMLCANAPHADYVSYDGQDVAIVRVLADKSVQAAIVERAKEFWDLVVNRSWKTEEQILDADCEALCADYVLVQSKIKDLELHATAIKKQVESIAQGRSSKAGNYLVIFSERKGSVDYGKIPELVGVDLEKYRKEPSSVMTIKEGKAK